MGSAVQRAGRREAGQPGGASGWSAPSTHSSSAERSLGWTFGSLTCGFTGLIHGRQSCAHAHALEGGAGVAFALYPESRSLGHREDIDGRVERDAALPGPCAARDGDGPLADLPAPALGCRDYGGGEGRRGVVIAVGMRRVDAAWPAVDA